MSEFKHIPLQAEKQRIDTLQEFHSKFPGIGRDPKVRTITNDPQTAKIWTWYDSAPFIYELGNGAKEYLIEVVDVAPEPNGSGGQLFAAAKIEDLTPDSDPEQPVPQHTVLTDMDLESITGPIE